MRTSFVLLFFLFVTPLVAHATDARQEHHATPELKSALFAGGNFWVLEDAFKGIKGIHSISVGYSGGKTRRPTYIDVSRGDTGHRETVQITYDPAVISYDRLLNIYWRNINPFDKGGQFCDRGEMYTTAVFVRGDEQKEAAEAVKAKVERRFSKKAATEILPASIFYPAEDYHQDYAEDHTFQYGLYKDTCGQEKILGEIWGEEAGGGRYRKAP